MSVGILVGPILGYESGDYYTICILTEPLAEPPVWSLESLNQRVQFTQVATVGTNSFWRAEIKLSVTNAGQSVSYAIVGKDSAFSERHGRTNWSFYIPGLGEQPKFAYASCNGFSSAKLARDTDHPYALWERMCEQHAKAPFSLLLMGGDQVYADQLWDSKDCPALQEWASLSWDEQNNSKVSKKIASEIVRFYDWLYIDRWGNKDMSLMFASVPSVMMWDDHDIFDGWGSYPEERQNCPVFLEAFKNARRVFEVFQLRCSSRNRFGDSRNHYALGFQFRDYHFVALDNRSERTKEQIMSEEQWQDVKTFLGVLEGQGVKNLVVLAGVPVVYRSFATVEAYLDATPWHEELEDDVHDHWTARQHQAERMRLVMVFLNFLESAKGCRGIILSGDVHVGALGQIWEERRQVGLTQIISSGIVHPPPSGMAWLGIRALTSDNPENLGDGEAVAEMLTPLGADRYLRSRNFVSLQIGTDQKLWVNWICELENRKPSFAIS